MAMITRTLGTETVRMKLSSRRSARRALDMVTRTGQSLSLLSGSGQMASKMATGVAALLHHVCDLRLRAEAGTKLARFGETTGPDSSR